MHFFSHKAPPSPLLNTKTLEQYQQCICVGCHWMTKTPIEEVHVRKTVAIDHEEDTCFIRPSTRRQRIALSPSGGNGAGGSVQVCEWPWKLQALIWWKQRKRILVNKKLKNQRPTSPEVRESSPPVREAPSVLALGRSRATGNQLAQQTTEPAHAWSLYLLVADFSVLESFLLAAVRLGQVMLSL